MSEPSQDKQEKPERPDTGLIPDEDLPDDLNPEENPLARDPDDERNDDSGGTGEKKVKGMPDAGG
jgi:hypothetical protein